MIYPLMENYFVLYTKNSLTFFIKFHLYLLKMFRNTHINFQKCAINELLIKL